MSLFELLLNKMQFQDRETSFNIAPGTSMFIHWLVGMVYVFYFASFILLLREVLRPGVLWFLRNLNDPDFNPVQEVCIMYLNIILEKIIYQQRNAKPNNVQISFFTYVLWQ